MAITVKKLRGSDIPDEMRAQDPAIEVAYRVEDADGRIHHRHTDVDAAALAVELSERDKRDGD